MEKEQTFEQGIETYFARPDQRISTAIEELRKAHELVCQAMALTCMADVRNDISNNIYENQLGLRQCINDLSKILSNGKV